MMPNARASIAAISPEDHDERQPGDGNGDDPEHHRCRRPRVRARARRPRSRRPPPPEGCALGPSSTPSGSTKRPPAVDTSAVHDRSVVVAQFESPQWVGVPARLHSAVVRHWCASYRHRRARTVVAHGDRADPSRRTRVGARRPGGRRPAAHRPWSPTSAAAWRAGCATSVSTRCWCRRWYGPARPQSPLLEALAARRGDRSVARGDPRPDVARQPRGEGGGGLCGAEGARRRRALARARGWRIDP